MSIATRPAGYPTGLAIGEAWGILRQYPEMGAAKDDVTEILARLTAGDTAAEDDLLPLVYVELHRMAVAQLRSERTGHTLQATALVHEVYLKLCGCQSNGFRRPHSFFPHFRQTNAPHLNRLRPAA